MLYESAIVKLSKSGVKKRTIELILAVIIGFVCVLIYRESRFLKDGKVELFLYLFSQGFMIQCAGLVLMNLFSLIGHFMLSGPKPKREMTIKEIQEYYTKLTNPESNRNPLAILQFLGALAILVGFISVGDGLGKNISPDNRISAYSVLAMMVTYWSFHVWNRIREFR